MSGHTEGGEGQVARESPTNTGRVYASACLLLTTR
jgi:hypothetical protein